MGANIIFCTFPDDIKRERDFLLMEGLGVAIIKPQIQNFFAGLMKCLGCHAMSCWSFFQTFLMAELGTYSVLEEALNVDLIN